LKVAEGINKMLVAKGYEGKELIFGIRPEDIHSEPVAIEIEPKANVQAKIEVAELLGAETMIHSRIGNTEFVARIDANNTYHHGDTIDLAFNMSKGHFFDKETEQVIVCSE